MLTKELNLQFEEDELAPGVPITTITPVSMYTVRVDAT